MFELTLRGELGDPVFEGAVLEQVEACTGNGAIVLWIALADGSTVESSALARRLANVEGLLPSALARHLPRKRTPEVRLRLVGGASR